MFVDGETFELMIEIPRGDGRRLHISYDRTHFVDLGPIKKVIPVNDGIMPVAYGFIIGTIGKEEGEIDELDAILYSSKPFKVGDRTRASPIAILHLENNDHKIIFADDARIKKWIDIPEKDRKLILDYFGYKSPIKRVGDKAGALRMIEDSITDRPLKLPTGITIIKEKAKDKN